MITTGCKMAAPMVERGRWTTLRQFVDWWWRSGTPVEPPDDAFRQHRGSHEFVMFRAGQYQVEQITLYPGHRVPPHAHPDVDTVETHLYGGGMAKVGGVPLPGAVEPRRDPRARRLLIPAGVRHEGMATVVNVAFSFQRWREGTVPTFITDNWVGSRWPA
jgi:hypothetical protein